MFKTTKNAIFGLKKRQDFWTVIILFFHVSGQCATPKTKLLGPKSKRKSTFDDSDESKHQDTDQTNDTLAPKPKKPRLLGPKSKRKSTFNDDSDDDFKKSKALFQNRELEYFTPKSKYQETDDQKNDTIAPIHESTSPKTSNTTQ